MSAKMREFRQSVFDFRIQEEAAKASGFDSWSAWARKNLRESAHRDLGAVPSHPVTGELSPRNIGGKGAAGHNSELLPNTRESLKGPKTPLSPSEGETIQWLSASELAEPSSGENGLGPGVASGEVFQRPGARAGMGPSDTSEGA